MWRYTGVVKGDVSLSNPRPPASSLKDVFMEPVPQRYRHMPAPRIVDVRNTLIRSTREFAETSTVQGRDLATPSRLHEREKTHRHAVHSSRRNQTHFWTSSALPNTAASQWAQEVLGPLGRGRQVPEGHGRQLPEPRRSPGLPRDVPRDVPRTPQHSWEVRKPRKHTLAEDSAWWYYAANNAPYCMNQLIINRKRHGGLPGRAATAVSWEERLKECI